MKKICYVLAILTMTGIACYGQKRPIIDWVSIPAGTFIMGSPTSEEGRGSNETQHQVTLSAFKMSKHEVTFEQYDLFCDATGRSKPDDEGWGRGNRPVINVTWADATAFAKWMHCRLPTEAEWEYACRAGTTTPFNSGENLTNSKAHFQNLYKYETMPVGLYPPNAWGLCDMHGNVSEWCSDWEAAYSPTAQTNPKGPKYGYGKVYRGGNSHSSARECRSACRNEAITDFYYSGLGFRLVSHK